MNDLIIDGNAKAGWETAITLERRLRLLLEGQLFRDLVHVGCRRSIANALTQLQQNFRNNFAGALHGFDFSQAL